MLKTLRSQNNLLLKKFKLEGNKELETKHNLISTLLSRDDCFFKMSMDTAFNILFDLGYDQQQSFEIYKQLICIENFKKIKNTH